MANNARDSQISESANHHDGRVHEHGGTSTRAGAKQRRGRTRKEKLICVAAFVAINVFVVALVVIVMFVPPTGSTDKSGASVHFPFSPPSESLSPNSLSLSPTESPAPTAAPTPPIPGCLRDRFDNEGNTEGNNRLYRGQFVCSRGDDKRYMFGLSSMGDLISIDTFTNSTKTYYTNEYHRDYVRRKEGCNSDSNNTDCRDLEEIADYYFSLKIDGSASIRRLERQTQPSCLPNCSTMEPKLDNLNADHLEKKETEIIQWELKPNYNISVSRDCLQMHDCPYYHLHRDGVIVLAWLDFSLSPWDGWMEKNIRRCYDFPTDAIF